MGGGVCVCGQASGVGCQQHGLRFGVRKSRVFRVATSGQDVVVALVV